MATRATHLQYNTQQEYYTNMSVEQRAEVARKSRSPKVHQLLQNDRAGKVRANLILNPAYKFNAVLENLDYSTDEIPKTVLDWVELYGTASTVKTLLSNPTVPNQAKKKLKPSPQLKPTQTVPQDEVPPRLTRKQQLDLLYSATPTALAALVFAPETDADIIYRIALTPHQGLKRTIAERTDLENGTLQALTDTGDIETVHLLASRKYLTSNILWDLYRKGEPEKWDEGSTWWLLADNPTVPGNLLTELFKRTTPLFWQYGFRKPGTEKFHSVLLKNPQFPAEIMLSIIRNRQKDFMEKLIPNPTFSAKDRAELTQLSL